MLSVNLYLSNDTFYNLTRYNNNKKKKKTLTIINTIQYYDVVFVFCPYYSLRCLKCIYFKIFI